MQFIELREQLMNLDSSIVIKLIDENVKNREIKSGIHDELFDDYEYFTITSITINVE